MTTLTSLCPSRSGARAAAPYQDSPQFRDGRFFNAAGSTALGFAKGLAATWKFMFEKSADAVPKAPVPVQALDRAQLVAAPQQSLWRLGHSTLLMKLDDQFFLTDPVFSERASPFSFAGPKRFHAPPLAIAELPPIAAVILSHDHYDHLDHDAIRQLAPGVGVFVTPLGVGDRLLAWGVPAHKVRQLDWWQSTRVESVELTAAPAQHFSGRGLSDGNRTLWCSWAIDSRDARVFFSGDSGYFDGFARIGERLGPFDLSLMETGAYNEQWPLVHMHPEQSLQAHLDVRARVMLPIHNGTFDLALHSWTDPFERISKLAAAQGVPLATPQIGERLDIRAPGATGAWWREVG